MSTPTSPTSTRTSTGTSAAPPEGAVLEIEDLSVSFATAAGRVTVTDGVSLSLRPGQAVGLVGESGSGKSVTGLAVLRLLPKGARIERGAVRLRGRDLLALSEREMADVRGREVAMVFQEPMTSLNPALTVGRQISWTLRRHLDLSRAAAGRRAVELLGLVGIPQPAARAGAYPHEFSGGMRQRVLIAGALACEPAVLVADEPTSALDVTTQAAILTLLQTLARELTMATLFTTHDMGVVADVCDDVVVMYAGQVVERRESQQLFDAPRHPYTRGLLDCLPRPGESELEVLPGTVPSADRYPQGCRFGPRCSAHREGVCDTPVELEVVAPAAAVRCRRWQDLDLTRTAADGARHG